MLEALAAAGATHINLRRDQKNSISSQVVRCIFEGRRAVAVAGTAKAEVQIKALLDVVELHLADAPAGGRVTADEVTVLVQDSPRLAEVRDALATLASAMRGGPAVRVLLLDLDGNGQPLNLSVPSFGTAATRVGPVFSERASKLVPLDFSTSSGRRSTTARFARTRCSAASRTGHSVSRGSRSDR